MKNLNLIKNEVYKNPVSNLKIKNKNLTNIKSKKSKSKKHDLKKLAEGWNNDIFSIQHPCLSGKNDLIATNPTVALAFLQATGARPDELEKGVRLFFEDRQLVAEIAGSKRITDADGKSIRGLEKRWITINPKFCKATDFLYRYVFNQLSNTQNSVFEFSYNKNTFRNVMANLSEKYNEIYRSKKVPISVTPYFFRHHMSACLKADISISAEDKAKVMGHLNPDSLQSYAPAYKRKSPIKPVLKVKASEEPFKKVQSTYIAEKINPRPKLVTRSHRSSPLPF